MTDKKEHIVAEKAEKISEAIKKDNGENPEKFDAMINELKNISKDIHQQTEKKRGIFSILFWILIIVAFAYGGFILYQADDKGKALSQMGTNIVQKTSEISGKIIDTSQKISSNIDAHNLQTQLIEITQTQSKMVEAITLLQKENTALREEISLLHRYNEAENSEKNIQKKFAITQLQAQIDFLEGKSQQPSINLPENSTKNTDTSDQKTLFIENIPMTLIEETQKSEKNTDQNTKPEDTEKNEKEPTTQNPENSEKVPENSPIKDVSSAG